MIRESATLTVRECALAGLVLLALMLICLGAAGALSLFSKSAWLDEYYSLFTAGIGSWRESLLAIRQGADFNPPLLATIYRVIGSVSGGVDATGLQTLNLRLFSFATLWVASVLLFVTLRREYGAGPSLIAAFSAWTHPLIIVHTFELRFYGLWLFFTVCLIASITWRHTRSSSLRGVCIAAASVGICTIHYFGIITWGLVILSNLASAGADSRTATAKRIAPSLAGPLALAFCIPFYLGQRRALPNETWLDAPALGSLFDLMSYLLVFCAGIAAILSLLHRMRGGQSKPAPIGPDEKLMRPVSAALLSLVLLPFILFGMSYLLQPVLLDRYCIATILAPTPLLALTLTRVGAPWRIVVLALFAIVCTASARAQSNEVRQRQLVKDQTRDVLRSRVGDTSLVIVTSRHTLYPLNFVVPPNVRSRLRFPLIPASMLVRVRTFDRVEQKLAVMHSAAYSFPRVQRIEELSGYSHVLLVAGDSAEFFHQQWMPNYRMMPLGREVYSLDLPKIAR